MYTMIQWEHSEIWTMMNICMKKWKVTDETLYGEAHIKVIVWWISEITLSVCKASSPSQQNESYSIRFFKNGTLCLWCIVILQGLLLACSPVSCCSPKNLPYHPSELSGWCVQRMTFSWDPTIFREGVCCNKQTQLIKKKNYRMTHGLEAWPSPWVTAKSYQSSKKKKKRTPWV